ncbi:hypothetical protein LZM85_07800 [Pseudomonas aeruginosa]|nr:hypothetical protein [Pseudomonas aeruginosa]
MIKNDSQTPLCTCPSGNGSLRHPCPAHPAAERSELWAVHAQGPDELYAAFSREDAEKHAAELNALPMPEGIAVGAVVVPSPWPEAEHWKYLAEQEREHVDVARAALAQPSQAQAEQATADDYEEVLADHRRLVRELDVLLNGEEGAAKQASLCDLVGQVSAIVRERRVPLLSRSQAEDAPVIGCLCGMPMTEGHHSPEGCTSLEEFAPQAQAEQAEAERPEVVAWRYGSSGGIVSDKACLDEWKSGGEYQSLMTVAQHERIVGELRAENERLANDRDRANQFANGAALEINAALARVAELEHVLRVVVNAADHGSWPTTVMHGIEKVREVLAGSAPPAKAQHSVPEGWKLVPSDKGCVTSSMKAECIGEFSFYIRAACAECLDVGTDSDCHVCGGDIEYDQKIDVPWDTCKEIYKTMLAAAPGKAQHSVPEVSGIGRDFAYPRSVVLYLRTEPTDDDLRAIHDGLRSLAAAPQPVA